MSAIIYPEIEQRKPVFGSGYWLDPWHPLNKKLIAGWLCNETAGATVFNVLGDPNYNGTLGYATTRFMWLNTILGPVLTFNGSTYYVTFPSFQPQPPLSIVLWFTSMTGDGNHNFFCGYSNGYGWYIHSNYETGKFEVSICGQYGAANFTSLNIPTSPFQLVLTINASTASLYLNGVLQQSGLNYYPNPGISYLANDYLAFGRAGATNYYGNSQISECWLYSRELTALDVAELYAHKYGTVENPRFVFNPKQAWIAVLAGGLSIPVAYDYYRRRCA